MAGICSGPEQARLNWLNFVCLLFCVPCEWCQCKEGRKEVCRWEAVLHQPTVLLWRDSEDGGLCCSWIALAIMFLSKPSHASCSIIILRVSFFFVTNYFTRLWQEVLERTYREWSFLGSWYVSLVLCQAGLCKGWWLRIECAHPHSHPLSE